MSSSSGKAKMPTVDYDTGGLYGSGTAGKTNSFAPTEFQRNLVNKTQSGMNQYLDQMISPTYDSPVFKAQTAQRNRLAQQSFENNVMNPLANRGLTRGSTVNQMTNEFNNNLINAEQNAMATEDQRVSNIMNQLATYWQIPYNNMMGLQQNVGNMVNAQMQSNAAANQAQSGLYGGIAQGLGSIGGGALSGYFGKKE